MAKPKVSMELLELRVAVLEDLIASKHYYPDNDSKREGYTEALTYVFNLAKEIAYRKENPDGKAN